MHRFRVGILFVSCGGVAGGRGSVVNCGWGSEQFGQKGAKRICPHLITSNHGMEFVGWVQHSVVKLSLAVGKLVVDVEIANLLAIGELRQVVVDAGNDRQQEAFGRFGERCPSPR